MNFTQQLPFLAALLIYILWFSCFGWNRLDQEPVGIHQWTQTDRQALTLRFAERGSPIFLPRTCHLVTPDGITSVDPPVVEWLAGMTMRITGLSTPLIYRIWMLLLHGLAMWMFWRATRHLTTHPAVRLVLFSGILFIPVYSYYALAYLPSAQAFSLFLIGLAQWMRYRATGNGFWYWVAMGIVCFWIRMPFILIWFYQWLILVVEEGGLTRTLRWALLPAVSAFAGQWLLKDWMTMTYGTQFLTNFLPANGMAEGLQTWWASLNFWMNEILSPTQWLAALIIFGLGLWYRPDLKSRIIYLMLILAGLATHLLHSLLLIDQFSAHEYYYLDVLLPVIVVMLVMATPRKKRFNPGRFSWIFLCLIPLWFWHAQEVFQEKDRVAATRGADMARVELRGCRSCLDDLGIPRTDTLLTFETYTSNGGLIACGRKGFSSLSTNPAAMKEDLKRRASVVVIPRRFLLPEVYQDYPAIVDWLIRIGGNEHIAVFRKLDSPTPGQFDRFMVPEGQARQRIPLFASPKELPHSWEWHANVDTSIQPWVLPAHQEYGPTLRLDPVKARHLAIRAKFGSRNGDHAVSWACDLSVGGQAPDIRYGSIPITHGDSLAWRAWETDLPDTRQGSPLSIYIWNGGGADLLVDSLEVLLW